MIATRDIKITIGIHPEFLDNNIEQRIYERAKNIIINKEINNLGLIQELEKIKSISGENISRECMSQFTIIMSVKLYIPQIDNKIKTKVKDVSLHGYYVDEPIQLFVGTIEKPTVKIGDIVLIKITKVGFNKGHFVVIAKQLKKCKSSS